MLSIPQLINHFVIQLSMLNAFQFYQNFDCFYSINKFINCLLLLIIKLPNYLFLISKVTGLNSEWNRYICRLKVIAHLSLKFKWIFWSLVRSSVIPSVCKYYIFIFFPRTAETLTIKLETTHSWVKDIEVYSNIMIWVRFQWEMIAM